MLLEKMTIIWFLLIICFKVGTIKSMSAAVVLLESNSIKQDFGHLLFGSSLSRTSKPLDKLSGVFLNNRL